jgi:hypothetical protein
MTPPAGVPNTLDLAVDPQLVHDLAETFNAGVGDKRAKILRTGDPVPFGRGRTWRIRSTDAWRYLGCTVCRGYLDRVLICPPVGRRGSIQ